MSEVELDRREPWTEAEYFALGESDKRIELIDGKLIVTPLPNRPHQAIADNLLIALKPAARTVGLSTHSPINVRLGPGSIVGPDLVVDRAGWLGLVTEAADVVLVCEVTSPGNASHDRVRKMELYAEAQVAWYLLVEPDMVTYRSLTLRLLRLEGNRYVEHAAAGRGQTLGSNDPFPFEIKVDDLFDF